MSREPQEYEPRGSVEILPPEPHEGEASSRIFIASGSHSVKFVKLGPVGTYLLLAALAVLAAAGLMFFAGAFLILAPVVVLLAAGAMVSGLIGNPFRRLR